MKFKHLVDDDKNKQDECTTLQWSVKEAYGELWLVSRRMGGNDNVVVASIREDGMLYRTKSSDIRMLRLPTDDEGRIREVSRPRDDILTPIEKLKIEIEQLKAEYDVYKARCERYEKYCGRQGHKLVNKWIKDDIPLPKEKKQ